jgi:hypothetical protein
VADGSRFREVQRELRGSKPESRGTEIEKFTTWGVAPKTTNEDYWKDFVVWLVLHSPVIDHGHHVGKWLSTGRVHWAPVPSKYPLAVFFSSCITRHGTAKMMVGRCGRHRILLWKPKRIGNWLAVHTRVHPRSKVYSVRGHEGRMVPLTIWSIRDLQSEFDGGWKVWDPQIANLEAGLPAEDLSANARATGEVLGGANSRTI